MVKYCCDPLKRHETKISGRVNKISDQLYSKCQGYIKKDALLCKNCISTLNKQPKLLIGESTSTGISEESGECSGNQSTSESENSQETSEFSGSELDSTDLSMVLDALNVTPMKAHSLTDKKKLIKSQAILEKTYASTKRKLESSFAISVPSPSKLRKELDDSTKKDELKRHSHLMNELVKAFHASKGPKTYERRINILSLSPYTIPKTMELFNASEYMVKKSRNFKKKYGILPQVPQMSKGKVITPEIKERVEAFFQLDEISRNCPGQKDSLSLRDTEGVKKHFQKRLVLMNLKECFEEYKKDPSNPKIGFSSFASLRPPFCVLAGSSGTHSVCVCTYHQNPKLQLAGLGIKELDYKILLGKTVCDMENRNCMMQQCSLCPGKEGVESFLINTVQSEDIHAQDSQIQYKQWVSTDRCTLEVKVESLEDYINSLSNKIWILTRHHFVSQQQSKYMKELKQNLNEFEAVILGDFSENYSFIVQDAAQGFHWENSQCTLHPFVVYWKDLSKNNALKHISYCALSPETRHNTVMVYSFLKVLLTDLKKRLPQILTIHYFSDGCAGQYKNRYNFSNLCSHEEDFGLQAIWHFFGTGHGKNACDGIGGTVKRSTARASIQRALNYQILNCEDMYTFCTTHLSKSINFFYLKKHDIEVNDIFLKERFENSVTIPGTQKFHKFVPLSKTKIKVFDLSSDIDGQEKFICKAKSLNLKTKPSVSAKIGDFIICSYDERKWVGMVTLFSEEFGDYTVDCMSPSGFCKYYTFPLIKDICLIPEEKVLTILETPSLKQGTTRIQYEFCSKELKKSFSN